MLAIVALSSVTSAAEPWPPAPAHCNVLVAGGSTAALAAALTAAEADSSKTVCLAEPTDWPGGQMTSSGVPAIDFGPSNSKPENQPRSFRELMAFVTAQQQRGPGCWVSKTCFDPAAMVRDWVLPRIAATPNLHLLDRAVVRAATRQASADSGGGGGGGGGGSPVSALAMVQRRARAGVDEWDTPLSQSLADWYSPSASARFEKRWLNVSADVIIEATEWGDVLLTAGLAAGQGVERPAETSAPGSDSTCGQAATLTFFMEKLDSDAPAPDPAPKGGTAGGAPFSSTGCCCPHLGDGEVEGAAGGARTDNCKPETIWSYRRAYSRDDGPMHLPPTYFEVKVGDVSQQNWGNPSGNDLDNAYLFAGLADARADVAAGRWAGGLNLTALAMLEERAYGWFWYYRAAFPAVDQPRLVLNRTFTGTATGLAKVPYLRDTRRSVGLGGFRARQASQTAAAGSGTGCGERFADSVGFGNYPSDDHNVNTCTVPSYMAHNVNTSTVPFYLPFRALTHQDAPNLLVAGKTMAQSFFFNSASRLHPGEWSSGVAAGGAAVLMLRNGWRTTAEVRTDELRTFLNSSAVGQPLEWTGVCPVGPAPAPTPVPAPSGG